MRLETLAVSEGLEGILGYDDKTIVKSIGKRGSVYIRGRESIEQPVLELFHLWVVTSVDTYK